MPRWKYNEVQPTCYNIDCLGSLILPNVRHYHITERDVFGVDTEWYVAHTGDRVRQHPLPEPLSNVLPAVQ